MQMEQTFESSSDHSEPEALREGEFSPDSPPPGPPFFLPSGMPAWSAAAAAAAVAVLGPRAALPFPRLPCRKPANARRRDRGGPVARSSASARWRLRVPWRGCGFAPSPGRA
ncbi:MAG: hypothetical protein WDW36_007648 [Sanguina aurantia]